MRQYSSRLRFEELGKAIILRNRLQNTTGATVTVEARVFEGRGAHELKQSEAFALIGSTPARLHEATYNSTVFDEHFDTRPTDISADTRLALTFVDFVDGRWQYAPIVERRRLEALISGTRSVLNSERELQRLRTT